MCMRKLNCRVDGQDMRQPVCLTAKAPQIDLISHTPLR